MSRNNLAILDEDAIVNDGIRILLMCHHESAMALPGSAGTNQCNNIHLEYLSRLSF